MKFKLFIIALLLMAIHSIGIAQQVEKNGLPCVAEICLGDGLAELAKVQWDRAKNPLSDPKKPLYTSTRKLNKYEIQDLKTRFPGFSEQAAPYLNDHIFDAKALVALYHVNAACSWSYLDGTYTTDSGNPTRVRIGLLPNMSDTTKQQWTVTFISREYPTAVTREQQKEVESQLEERYRTFNKGLHIPKLGEGTYRKNSIGSFGFNLNLYSGDGGDILNRLKSNPICGGNEKVKLD
jgi:hypothetical protein